MAKTKSCAHELARPVGGKLGDIVRVACPCGGQWDIVDQEIESRPYGRTGSALERAEPAFARLVGRNVNV